MHRLRYLSNPEDEDKGILNAVRSDGRLTCGINSFNTSTGRSTHNGLVNMPSMKALFGEPIRRCVVAPEGRVFVSSDMASAQLQIAAYYANNLEFYEAVLNGQEYDADHKYVGKSGHCLNSRLFTLVSEEEWLEAVKTQDPELIKSITLRRAKSKNGVFAIIFGCGDGKLASTLGIKKSFGAGVKKAYLENMGLERTFKVLDKMVKTNKRGGGGYIELPMGYYCWCPSPHKQMNYLVQGTEAVAQKLAQNHMEMRVRQEKLDGFCIMSMHDEYTWEASPEDAQRVGELLDESYKAASQKICKWHREKSLWFDYINFEFDLSGGFDIATNYRDVH